jgi:hypothetical protein
VSAGTVSLPANAILQTNVSGLPTILLRAQNAIGGSGGNATLGTISTNILTINFITNNQSPIFVTPTANFSLVLTNVPTSQVNAIYNLEIYISARFYCSSISVNGTALTMVSVGGMANIASQVNVSATGLIQTFIVFFTGTITPTKVITELKSTW